MTAHFSSAIKLFCVFSAFFTLLRAGPFHHFPKPDYPNLEKFEQWKMVLDENVKEKGDSFIYNNVRICDNHFEKFYRSASKLLTRNAVPTLNLPLSSSTVPSSSAVETAMDVNMQTRDNLESCKLSYPKQKQFPKVSACQMIPMTSNFENIKFSNFNWLNEPSQWSLANDVLEVRTENKTDFWQGTWYNFYFNTGHVYGVELKEDFTMEILIEADFETLYDQAGLMIYVDEKHWLKAGIEYNDGQPMISSVLTNENSDWGTGVYPGNPRKFWLRLTKVGAVVCVKYSTDGITWTLLRLSPFPVAEKYFVGPMCCTPQREGLIVKFSGLTIRQPDKDILHAN